MVGGDLLTMNACVSCARRSICNEAMAFRSGSLVALIFLVALAVSAGTCSAARPEPYGGKNLNFIRSSCGATQYPSLCFSSLSAYASTIQRSPVQLAQAALSVSLTGARTTAATITKLLKGSGAAVGAREAEAMNDCLENMGNSVEELRDSLKEMGHLKGKDLRLRVNDMQTWVSSALTDENTCMEGLPTTASMKVGVRGTIRGEIVKAVQLTSNALSLINGLSGV